MSTRTDIPVGETHDIGEVGVRSGDLVDIGACEDYLLLPARVLIEGRSYYLVNRDGALRLLSTVCPHKGGEVRDVGDGFECPKHGWRFEHGGACLTTPGEELTSFDVEVVDERLVAHLPETAAPASALGRSSGSAPVGLNIRLHAHACLEIDWRGFSLLTDPWLHGPAFMGAWTQFPPPLAKAEQLAPDVIWISHEHSDHFHEPTLERFDRTTPVYVPAFPNERMERRLAELGFANVVAMPFGEPHELAEGLTITCFEPGSLWNDALVLIDAGGFRLLNVNDAGINQRVASLVAPVDAVASSFSPGASGYPLSWTHLDAAQQADVMTRAREGMIAMLRSAMEVYGGRYLIPFASHFALWHPQHRDYLRALRRNSLQDVVEGLADLDVVVADLMPGEHLDVGEGNVVRRWRRRERFADVAFMESYVERTFDEQAFAAAYPAARDLPREALERYFLTLNEAPDIAFCEDVTATVRALDEFGGTPRYELGFAVSAGRLRVLEHPPAAPSLTIEAPIGVLARIVCDNVSWDEAHIGYWCRFSRSPDIYHAGFWRLLQAPYFHRPAEPPAGSRGWITADSVIADVIEEHGPLADRIMRRYGLYCVGCRHSSDESIGLGARSHGVEDRQVARLVRELNEAFAPQSAGNGRHA